MEMLLLVFFLYSQICLVITACATEPQVCSKCKDEEVCVIKEIYNIKNRVSGNSTTCDNETTAREVFQFEFHQPVIYLERFFHKTFLLNNCTDITFSFNSTPSFAPALKQAGWELLDSPFWKSWPQCTNPTDTCESYIDIDFSFYYRWGRYQLSCKNPCLASNSEARKEVFIENFLDFLQTSDIGIVRPAAHPTITTVAGSENRTQTQASSRTSATPTRKTVAIPDSSSETNNTASLTATEPDTNSTIGLETNTKTSTGNGNTGTTDTTVPESISSGTPIEKQTSAHTLKSTTPSPKTKTHSESASEAPVTVTTKSTTTRHQDEKDEDSSSDLWWIIPVVIILVVLLVCAAIIGFFCWRKYKNIASDVTQSSGSVKSADQPIPEASNSTSEPNPKLTGPQASPKIEPTDAVNPEEAAEVVPAAVPHLRQEVDKLVEADGGEQDHSMQTSEGLLDKLLREMREKEKLENASIQQSNKSGADRTQPF